VKVERHVGASRCWNAEARPEGRRVDRGVRRLVAIELPLATRLLLLLKLLLLLLLKLLNLLLLKLLELLLLELHLLNDLMLLLLLEPRALQVTPKDSQLDARSDDSGRRGGGGGGGGAGAPPQNMFGFKSPPGD